MKRIVLVRKAWLNQEPANSRKYDDLWFPRPQYT